MSKKIQSNRGVHALAAAALSFLAAPAFGFTVSLNTDVATPQAIGAAVELQATVTGADPGADLVYQFDVRPSGGSFRTLQAFRDNDTFKWATPNAGAYQLRVLVRDRVTDELQGALISFGRTSPASGGSPVILPTAHPQVVLHSSPPCPNGATALRVAYWLSGNPGAGVNTTNFKPCTPGRTVSHYVGGMIGDASYTLMPQILAGGTVVSGTPLNVTAGTAEMTPENTVLVAPNPETSIDQDVMVLSYIQRSDDFNFGATDINGNIIWSFSDPGLSNALLVRPSGNGRFLVSTTVEGGIRSQILREYDLAGNIYRETNASVMDEQLLAKGEEEMGGFHHEALRLANGHTLLLVSVEQFADQGNGVELVYGEMVLDLDTNWNISWVWNSFDHLDVSQGALNGEVCENDVETMTPAGGCPWIWNGDAANDWLHMNAINYSPSDGNIILSARHRDAVYKVDYADGTGSGALVWELGEYGDFTIIDASGDPWPWFSHQHDPRYFGGELTIYDNGNSRQGNTVGATENSRGQVYILDEVNMTAELAVNIDLDHYAAAVGSSQKLSNGNYFFHSGFLGNFVDPRYAAIETDGSGSYKWAQAGLSRAYRGFRMKTLYAE